MLALMAIYHVMASVVTHFHKLVGAGVVVSGLAIFARPLGRLLRRYLLDTWLAIDAQAARARAESPGGFDYRPLVVMLTTAVSLTLIEYYGTRQLFGEMLKVWMPALRDHPYYRLFSYVYWSGFRVVFYVVVPWLVVLAMPGERLRNYGMSTAGLRHHLWIYGLLYLIVLPPVVMVSFTQPFLDTYPFYKNAPRSWTDFLLWQLVYGLQFFGLEVFFRGFMIHPLKRALGAQAIFVMVVPYCMIHYHKPLAEVLGAVVAGLVLGTLSLHTGSIWAGVMIHVSVAFTMDILAVHHTAGYPGNPRFVGPR